jgi:hypothetical protein
LLSALKTVVPNCFGLGFPDVNKITLYSVYKNDVRYNSANKKKILVVP